MTDVNQLLTTPDTGPNGQIERDRWGRYLLPHPMTGKKQPWTRVTTLSNTLADRFALEKWAQRNIVYGLGQRQDLYAKAAAARLEDKDILSRVVDEAKAAAADKAGANLGSAIHQFTERINRGEQVNVPPPYDRDINAYQQTIDAAGMAVVLGWVERVVIIPELEVVGTLDCLCDGPWQPPLPRVADLKTGKDVVHFGMAEIPLQLALYAHGTHWWDGNTWHPMPPVDQNAAVVIHLPVGQGVCTLYEVDIQAGWQAVQLAVDVRNWRKRKDLAQQIPAVPPAVQAAATGTPATTSPVTAGVPVNQLSTARVEWIRARVQRILDHGHGTALAMLWSAHRDIPTFKTGGPTSNEQIDLLSRMCEQVEKETEMPFGASDPATPPQTKKERTRA